MAAWKHRRVLRILIAFPLAGIACVAALLCLLWLDHLRSTQLPMPTGPLAVGRTRYVWHDPAHPDPMAPRPGISRTLLAWIWYPATRPSHPTYDDYLPAHWRAALEQQSGVVLTNLFTRDLARVRAHSIRDADLSDQERAYPVALMRGGHSALTADYTSLAEDLASHGYIVVGFDAPYRTFVTVLPDGAVIARAPQNNAELLIGEAQVRLATRLVAAWSWDMSFAVDQLERLNAGDPPSKFQGRLDLHDLGAFGHSLGGAEALQFCHDDARCKAGIDVDGAPFGSVVAQGVSQPFLFLMSDHSSEPAAETGPVLADLHSIFDRLPPDKRLQVTIRGADHFGFSDDIRSAVVMGVMRTLGKRIDGRRQLAIAAHYISTFFDTYLKGAPASDLEKSQYQEVRWEH
jgi:predicted dienelactone hydrolase